MSILTYAKKALRFFDQDGSTFVFGIPLIGCYLSDDFEGACKLLGQTLESCLRQTDDNFEIYVACNEIPDVALVPSSQKIHYVRTMALSRSELEAQPRADVSLKRLTLMKTAAAIRARYYFQLDADDLVSENLVRYVGSANDKNGYIFATGYLLDSRTQSLYPVPNQKFPSISFDELCGSSNIISLDLSPGEEAKQQNLQYLKKILWQGHENARKAFENEGRAAHPLTFPACIYRANHGSNLYLRLNRSERTDFIDAVASNCAPLAGAALERVKREFGLED